MPQIDQLLEQTRNQVASDLHLQPEHRPHVRIHGDLVQLKSHDPLGHDKILEVVHEMLRPDQQATLAEQRYFDYSYSDPSGCRWRCHAFYQETGLAAAFRRLSGTIPSVRELQLPSILETLADLRSGLVLITGATGSGKSTTLAAILGLLIRKYRKHVITLEDPIEYVFADRHAIVHQREVGTHVRSFDGGLEDAIAEGPDVLVVGEIRDYTTIRLALSAAETGTLVFSTLHSNNACESVHRLVDVFPSEEQPLARAMISQSLKAVVSQVLLQTIGKQSRVPACEILFHTPAMANLIREHKIHELNNCIQTGGAMGMQLLDDSLAALVKKDKITADQAMAYARSKERFAS